MGGRRRRALASAGAILVPAGSAGERWAVYEGVQSARDDWEDSREFARHA
ncbi:MAG TPA: hypothetical protein VN907_04725 [Actinomycetes bacterium]|nr:hypothetical protein [Actinomycetes bacterium]